MVAVGISLALVAGAFGAQSSKKGGKMATVIRKEQILSGELGVPNFPEKVGAWHLASDWKTEGQAGGEWSHRATVTYAHEQDSEKKVGITVTLYRSVEGARKALEEALEGIKQHNQSESVKGVGVEALHLYGVARREVKSAGVYYVVYKAGTGDAYMGESFGLPLPGSIPTGAFWAWKNVFVGAGDGILALGFPMSLEEADSFISSLLADVAKRWVKPRQTRGENP
jgi:hypothetical protein